MGRKERKEKLFNELFLPKHLHWDGSVRVAVRGMFHKM